MVPSRRLLVVAVLGLAAAVAGVARASDRDEGSRADAAPASRLPTQSEAESPAALPPSSTGRSSTTGPSSTASPSSTTGAASVAPVHGGEARDILIRIGVDDTPQALVDAAPEGATFVLEAGVHERFAVHPKRDQTFLGEAGTVLDGGGVVAHAFAAAGDPDAIPADGVRIMGASADQLLVVRNYAGPLQTAAVHPHVDTRPELGMGRGWLVQWCDVYDNRATGIRVADGMVVRENRVHDNGQLGVGGTGRDIVIEGNDVGANRTRRDVDPDWEGGGIKLVGTIDARVIGNTVHHNRGTGIWFDIEAVGSVVADNIVADNDGAGIFDEISYGTEIRDNTVTGNGVEDAGWYWHAGIQIAASSNVTVMGNVVRNNRQGILLLQQERGEGSQGPYRIDQVVIRGNELIDTGVTGAARDDEQLALYDAAITFADNHYESDVADAFTWHDALIDRDAWSRLGHDT